MTTIRTGLMAAMLALGATAATAQGSGARPPADPTLRCAAERAWLAAEATTPGILQRLAAEALELCLAGAPAAVPAVAPAQAR